MKAVAGMQVEFWVDFWSEKDDSSLEPRKWRRTVLKTSGEEECRNKNSISLENLPEGRPEWPEMFIAWSFKS